MDLGSFIVIIYKDAHFKCLGWIRMRLNLKHIHWNWLNALSPDEWPLIGWFEMTAAVDVMYSNRNSDGVSHVYWEYKSKFIIEGIGMWKCLCNLPQVITTHEFLWANRTAEVLLTLKDIQKLIFNWNWFVLHYLLLRVLCIISTLSSFTLKSISFTYRMTFWWTKNIKFHENETLQRKSKENSSDFGRHSTKMKVISAEWPIHETS